MACMNDYESVDFKCGYEPCQHEGTESFHKYDMKRHEVKNCPKCGVWNYKSNQLQGLITAELEAKLDEAVKKHKPDNKTLRTERDALAQALEELVELKNMKDEFGKQPEYLIRQPLAWEAAKQVLNTLEV